MINNLLKKEGSRRIGLGLSGLALLANLAAIGCTNSGKNNAEEPGRLTSIERYEAAKGHVDHTHKSELYTGGLMVSERSILELEAKGYSHIPMPSRSSLSNLKDHHGEWTILQEGYVPPGAALAGNVLPYIDGQPGQSQLYRPFALYQSSPGESANIVPRIFANKSDYLRFRGTLEDVAIYPTLEDSVKDIKRINGVLSTRRDVGASPNIVLTPVQINSELIKRYAQ